VTTVPEQASCCAPLTASPLSAEQAADLAVRLKAIADPARLRLLSLLLASDGQEACTCDLTEPLGLSQPTVTHHLRKLLEARMVTASRRGVWTYYRVDPQALAAIAAVISPPEAGR
jgi:ArsR family transcriptional regulator, arsenate/arsenite/antimonite-responsive transcriptional repressor